MPTLPSLSSLAAGAAGVVLVALLATIGWYRFVTVPGLRSQLATAQAALQHSEAQAAIGQADLQALQAAQDAQNAKVRALASGCQAQVDAARQSALQEALRPISPLKVRSAADLNQWLQELLK